MSEELEVKQEEKQAPKTYTAEEVEALVSGLKAKTEELLTEKKTISQRARELEEAQQLAEEARLKEKEEFKTLYEREQLSKKELAEKYESFSKRIQTKDIENDAFKLASTLTQNTEKAALLQQQAMQFARYTDNGVVYEMGGVEVGREKVLEHLTNKYHFLVDVKSSGGGAIGSSSGATARQATRAEFDKMNDGAKMKFIKDGGKVVN